MVEASSTSANGNFLINELEVVVAEYESPTDAGVAQTNHGGNSSEQNVTMMQKMSASSKSSGDASTHPVQGIKTVSPSNQRITVLRLLCGAPQAVQWSSGSFCGAPWRSGRYVALWALLAAGSKQVIFIFPFLKNSVSFSIYPFPCPISLFYLP